MAAIDVNVLKTTVDYFCKRNSRGRNSGADFGVAATFSSRELFMDRFGNPLQNQPGRPVPRIAYEQNIKISDDLRPFKIDDEAVQKVNNVFTYPRELAHVIAINTTECLESAVRVNENEIRTILNSKVVPPTLEYPVYVQYMDYFKVYPSTINNITVSYLKRPRDIVWAYTVVNGREVFDSVNSKNPEWEGECFNELVIRILSCYGIALKDTELQQIAEVKETKGV